MWYLLTLSSPFQAVLEGDNNAYTALSILTGMKEASEILKISVFAFLPE